MRLSNHRRRRKGNARTNSVEINIAPTCSIVGTLRRMNIDLMPAISFVLPSTTKTTTVGNLWLLVVFVSFYQFGLGLLLVSCFQRCAILGYNKYSTPSPVWRLLTPLTTASSLLFWFQIETDFLVPWLMTGLWEFLRSHHLWVWEVYHLAARMSVCARIGWMNWLSLGR